MSFFLNSTLSSARKTVFIRITNFYRFPYLLFLKKALLYFDTVKLLIVDIIRATARKEKHMCPDIIPSQPKEVKPSPTKWVIGIIIGLGLIALAQEMYQTTEPWLSVGLLGAAGVGVFGGIISAAFDRANPASRVGVGTALAILIVGTVIAGLLAGWWAALFAFICVGAETATNMLYV